MISPVANVWTVTVWSELRHYKKVIVASCALFAMQKAIQLVNEWDTSLNLTLDSITHCSIVMDVDGIALSASNE